MLNNWRRKLAAWLYPLDAAALLSKYRPISDQYGLDRGRSVDRWYIEQFLSTHRSDIHGTCLEILDRNYTRKYGRNKVAVSHILDIDQGNIHADIYGDLRDLHGVIKSNTYDCLILTQVFQYIDDHLAAIRECHRILKPGGVLLATMPTICRVDCVAGDEGDYWRYTRAGSAYLFAQAFKVNRLQVQSVGNILTGIGFWIGLSQEDYHARDFAYNDPNFPCLTTVRAIK